MASSAATLNSTNVRNSVIFAWQRIRLAVTSAFAPSIAVDMAARIFATPPRFAHPQAELEALAKGTRFAISSGTGRIAAWRYADASRPAIVLSHGWGGRGAQLREFVPALVDAGYQVVVFDHVAHGASDGGESTIVHFMRGIEAVVANIESNGARVVGMIGHSLGAAAVAAWLNETKREMRVALVAPPTSVERYSGYFARKLGIPERIRSAMQQRIETRLGYRWESFELPNSVARIQALALIVHDSDDRDVPVTSGLALARAWRGARFLQTKGLGHRRILRDAGVVADVVDFMKDRTVFAPPPRRGEASAYRAPAPIV
jgi:pimeloyl-ACP methyl ester carboxylesterase